MALPGPNELLVFAILIPLATAILLMVWLGGWRFGRWQAGAVWSATLIAALGILPVALLQQQILIWLFRMFEDILAALIVGIPLLAFLEELLKLLAIIITAAMFRRSVTNDPLKLLAVGAAAGLAFATVENLFYFYGFGFRAPHTFWWIVGIRTLGTLPMHIVCGLVLALFVIRGRQEPGAGHYRTALLAAGGLHTLFNAAAIIGNYYSRGGRDIAVLLAFIGAATLVVLFVGLAVKRRAEDMRRAPAVSPPAAPPGGPQPPPSAEKPVSPRGDDGPVIRR